MDGSDFRRPNCNVVRKSRDRWFRPNDSRRLLGRLDKHRAPCGDLVMCETTLVRRHSCALRLVTIIIAVAPPRLPCANVNGDDRDVQAQPATNPIIGKEAGQVRDHNGLKLVWCPPGFLTMEQVEESDADGRVVRATPVHVFLTHGYWLGMYEVTQAEWFQVMKTEPWAGNDDMPVGEDYPATYVSWRDAMDFGDRLTSREREAGRLPNNWAFTLPTESQWERACRAYTETNFSFGDDESKLHEYAWCEQTALAGEISAHKVGQKKPNQWGLFDMHGNVVERCRDYFSETLPGGRDPEVTVPSVYRVVRGGFWNDATAECRSAHRNERIFAAARGNCVGFRIALVPANQAAKAPAPSAAELEDH